MPDSIRAEHAVQSGSTISPFYDSMIAKLISHGATRDEARGTLICGLEQALAFGVTTNQAFLTACLRHPAFARGETTTAFIADHRDELLMAEASPADVALAALLLAITSPYAPPWRRGRTLTATFPVPIRIEVDRAIHELDICRAREGNYLVRLAESDCRFAVGELSGDLIRFHRNGVLEAAHVLRDGDLLHFQQRGITHTVRDLSLASPKTAASGNGEGKVRAAMNGRVVAIPVKPGDRVSAGQPALILEAMKMEHVHVAGIAGTIAAIDVAEGDQVTTGQILIEIDAG
jgi:geranyl-CoA carboxylase alpha subunit